MIIEKNISCTLSDGTILRADVYRPNTESEYPVLMLRLPYDKETPRYYDEYLEVPRMVEAGYVVILQDVRGRFASEGEFFPCIHEAQDGYESVEWAANLPYSNGKVGLFGMSYHGYTQLAAATERPPSLKAIAPVMTSGDLLGGFVGKEDEATTSSKLQTWVLGSMLEDQLKRKGTFNQEAFDLYYENIAEWLSHAPADDWKPIKDLDADSYYFDLINDTLPAEWKKETNLLDKIPGVTIPALFIGGWFDALLNTTLEVYAHYGGEKMLWIGPWTHEEMTGRCGERFFPHAKTNIGVDHVKDPTEIHIEWFDKWLKDKPMSMEKPVHLYLMEENRWEAYDLLPVNNGIVEDEWFLHSQGASQTREGDGRLMKHSLANETESKMKLDPQHPVPTRGGGSLIAGNESGMFDMGDIQDREDVLVYTSAPLDEDYPIRGTIRAQLWMSAQTELVDIALRITDVDPEGRPYNIVDSFHREKLNVVGEPFCMEVDIGTTAYTLKKGHQLRLDMAASNAPLYDINLNNGKTTKTHTSGKVAFESIFHGGNKHSAIFVPTGKS